MANIKAMLDYLGIHFWPRLPLQYPLFSYALTKSDTKKVYKVKPFLHSQDEYETSQLTSFLFRPS